MINGICYISRGFFGGGGSLRGICGVHEANMLQNLICFSKKIFNLVCFHGIFLLYEIYMQVVKPPYFVKIFFLFGPILAFIRGVNEINVVSIIGEGVRGYIRLFIEGLQLRTMEK